MEKDEVFYLNDENEVIPADEVVPSPRGKHIDQDDELVESFKTLKEWEALRLGRTFGRVKKEERSKVAHIIRRHWRLAREDSPRIDFSPEGVAQVRVRTDRRAA